MHCHVPVFVDDLGAFSSTQPFIREVLRLHLASAPAVDRGWLAALRDPVLVGKTLATLDVISDGRIDMAVGLGWTADEYTWTGNNWKTRGKRMNETINFAKNVALVGAALTMMQIDEPWPISVDEARADGEEMFIRLGGRDLRALPA